eukprot:TRINITY_DN20250_c0_g1_i1.p1 TRINITY_DN20250_c0_g1~~TRINITY_DN20250_c0_g1_i1.p1  ORF type:complete len:304 (+),score=36.30 TRINITY_DN20250_c0_g1_i1:24-914(+)
MDLAENSAQNQGENGSALFDILRATTAFALARFLMHPLQRASVLCQVEHRLVEEGRLEKPLGSSTKFIGFIWNRDGLTGLWRGAVSGTLRHLPLFGSLTTVAVRLAALPYLRAVKSLDSPIALALSVVAVDVVAHTATETLVYPLEVATTLLTSDLRSIESSNYRFAGVRDSLSKVSSGSEGRLAWWRGLKLSLAWRLFVRAALAAVQGVQLLIEEQLPLLSMSLGVAAPLAVAVADHATDVIRRRMIVGTGAKDETATNVAKRIVHEQGSWGLTSGLGGSMLHDVGVAFFGQLLS